MHYWLTLGILKIVYGTRRPEPDVQNDRQVYSLILGQIQLNSEEADVELIMLIID